MSFANTTENYIMDHIKGTSWSAPAGLYVQLHTADPTETCDQDISAETERKVVTFGGPASGGIITSNSDVSWTSWDKNTETISHVSIWSAATDGYAIMYGALDTSRQVNNDDTFTISSGNLTMQAS